MRVGKCSVLVAENGRPTSETTCAPDSYTAKSAQSVAAKHPVEVRAVDAGLARRRRDVAAGALEELAQVGALEPVERLPARDVVRLTGVDRGRRPRRRGQLALAEHRALLEVVS